jgi:hypothetical protein
MKTSSADFIIIRTHIYVYQVFSSNLHVDRTALDVYNNKSAYVRDTMPLARHNIENAEGRTKSRSLRINIAYTYYGLN